MENRKTFFGLNMALGIVVIVSGACPPQAIWRWIFLLSALVGLVVEVSAVRRPGATGAPASCSFCARPAADGRKLVHGPNLRICTNCLSLTRQISAQTESDGQLPGSRTS